MTGGVSPGRGGGSPPFAQESEAAVRIVGVTIAVAPSVVLRFIVRWYLRIAILQSFDSTTLSCALVRVKLEYACQIIAICGVCVNAIAR